ncbi:N-glycosylase/DNA lyase [Trichophyton violaceum]|uniref:DNA-(apurinic or apyrimidinic site) lyase n=1 Tax=Trichophyton violaceum TaxID=34388 RepID=A0A178FEX3_TRIVO|nr:N-glycosylase/DNA lyase [Trichophyton violaceum]
MSIGRFSEWRKLPLTLKELCIDTTLRCGQSFRWRKLDDEWTCSLYGRVLSLKQDSDSLWYRSFKPSSVESSTLPTPPVSNATTQRGTPDDDDTEALIHHYFNLEYNLSDLYEQWAASDPIFKKKAVQFAGIRIMRQDAWETLVSFICSSNNNIARISQMVEKLCINYGPFIGQLGDQKYYDFPEPSALTGTGVESHLRELGFGYRAKYIYQTAKIVANQREPGWLNSLRNPEKPAFNEKPATPGSGAKGDKSGYREAHEQLLTLQGVGPKVADCVCLMGLGWGESVPVDTHVWQIAQRDYRFGKGKQKTLNKATYDAVGDHFRELWGKEAGWAQSVLFTANLRSFSDRLNPRSEVHDQSTETLKVESKVEATQVKEEVEEDGIRITTRISVKRELSEGEDTGPKDNPSVSEPVPKKRRTRASRSRK